MKTKTIQKLSVLICTMLIMISMISAQITGDGNIVIQERDVGDFTGIVIKSGIDVMIKQGGQQSLEIKADENLQQYIISEVENGVLNVYVKVNTRILRSHAMDAMITVKEIEMIKVSGGGDVEGQSMISSDEITIGISGGGDLMMQMAAGEATCNVSGGGDVELSGDIEELALSISGGGDLELDAQLDEFSASISGGGDAEIDGDNATVAAVSLSGGGDLAMDISAETIAVSMTGGGDASVDAGDGVETAAFSSTGGGDLNIAIRAETLAISVGGGGDAAVEGSADEFACEMRSGGDLSAGEFKARNASLKLTGGSNATIHVDENLEVEASGGGQVWISGDPEIDAKLSGGSKVHKK